MVMRVKELCYVDRKSWKRVPVDTIVTIFQMLKWRIEDESIKCLQQTFYYLLNIILSIFIRWWKFQKRQFCIKVEWCSWRLRQGRYKIKRFVSNSGSNVVFSLIDFWHDLNSCRNRLPPHCKLLRRTRPSINVTAVFAMVGILIPLL